MVNVANGSDVDVWLGSFKFSLSHIYPPKLLIRIPDGFRRFRSKPKTAGLRCIGFNAPAWIHLLFAGYNALHFAAHGIAALQAQKVLLCSFVPYFMFSSLGRLESSRFKLEKLRAKEYIKTL
jgi:hypothetical protein